MLGFGLRPRLLAALVLTSAVTLGVAALALLSPLEDRLRSSGEASLVRAAESARGELHQSELDPRSGQPDPTDLQGTLSLLRRQASAQAWVLNDRLEPISRGAPSDLDVPAYYPQLERVLTRGRKVRSLYGTLFVVAMPLRIGRGHFVLVVTKRLNYVTSAVGVVQSAFIEAATAGLAIALLLGIGLSSTLLRRLRRLRDGARELERRGLATPLDLTPGRDEIGELAHTLKSMQAKLSQQDSALRAFVATASHELRTPLTSLDGLLELIEDDLDPSRLDLADARERTEHAREQSRRLSHLASDLLDLSRLDAEVSLRAEPVELTELARAVAAELELRAAEGHVGVRIDAAADPAWVSADPGAVARVVRILLDNALRVSPPGATIEIAVERDGALVVRDEGPGVPADERELIFERFRRGRQTSGHGGFGLGLAIGRELTERMGGTLVLLDDDAGRRVAADGTVNGAPGDTPE
ncbi:MAG: HAMP domain-containing histidine kinase, partial [Acidobacteriota bacterium]|nr:HAMP domain-containing histidine kinase [Acidobacteriota bacterium]